MIAIVELTEDAPPPIPPPPGPVVVVELDEVELPALTDEPEDEGKPEDVLVEAEGPDTADAEVPVLFEVVVALELEELERVYVLY